MDLDLRKLRHRRRPAAGLHARGPPGDRLDPWGVGDERVVDGSARVAGAPGRQFGGCAVHGSAAMRRGPPVGLSLSALLHVRPRR
jgi:hypothetical protein